MDEEDLSLEWHYMFLKLLISKLILIDLQIIKIIFLIKCL
jgi:hypothetical protein